MKIAIVGSRDFQSLSEVAKYVGALPPGTTVISGGARGVDYVAQSAATRFGLAVEIFKPDWRTHGKRAGLVRNQQMVDACDYLVAFWDGRSPGTIDSIDRARRAGKLKYVFGINLKEEGPGIFK